MRLFEVITMQKIKKHLKFLSLILSLTIILPVILIDCFTSPGGQEEISFYEPPVTPGQCLENLLYCFEHFTDDDIVYENYDSILHEDYTFYFDPNEDDPVPVSWNKDTDVLSTYNMFEQVEDITFGTTENQHDIDTEWKNENEPDIFTKTIDINFILMINEIDGYQAAGECEFTFQKDSTGAFFIIVWRDHTASN
jgi:hypothetical protein